MQSYFSSRTSVSPYLASLILVRQSMFCTGLMGFKGYGYQEDQNTYLAPPTCLGVPPSLFGLYIKAAVWLVVSGWQIIVSPNDKLLCWVGIGLLKSLRTAAEPRGQARCAGRLQKPIASVACLAEIVLLSPCWHPCFKNGIQLFCLLSSAPGLCY